VYIQSLKSLLLWLPTGGRNPPESGLPTRPAVSQAVRSNQRWRTAAVSWGPERRVGSVAYKQIAYWSLFTRMPASTGPTRPKDTWRLLGETTRKLRNYLTS